MGLFPAWHPCINHYIHDCIWVEWRIWNKSNFIFLDFVFEYLSLKMVFLNCNFQTGFFTICCLKKELHSTLRKSLVQNYMVFSIMTVSELCSVSLCLFLISDSCLNWSCTSQSDPKTTQSCFRCLKL